jgi:hypothetical protein
VGAAFFLFRFEEVAVWGRSEREGSPGARHDVATIVRSLTACDSLARPGAARWIRSVLTPEREDRLARSIVLRRMGALLNAELQERGLNASDPSDDGAIVALFGADAIAILRPRDGTPVTMAGIESCLEALERVSTDTQGLR